MKKNILKIYLSIFVLIFLAAYVFFVSSMGSVLANDEANDNHYQDNDYSEFNCEEETPNEWHWVITQSDKVGTAPTHIHAYFENAGVVEVPYIKTAGGSIHYALVGQYLGDTLESPGSSVYIDEANLENWRDNNPKGRLNLSHGPCIKPLDVTKTADTYYKRTWTWDIDKTVDPEDFGEVEEGELYTANYEVKVSAYSTDSDWNVSGEIKIYNPENNPIAVIESIEDVLDSSGAVTVDCGDAVFPYDLDPDDELVCTYDKDAADTSDELNTVTVTTSGDVPGDTAEANVIWEDPELVNECVNVYDDKTDPSNHILLGKICADDLDAEGEYEFTYSLVYSSETGEGVDLIIACGENEFTNTAWIKTIVEEGDPEILADESATVTATLVCACTLTQGYWKTHSSYGPAPYNPTWFSLENDDFFYSEKTYYQVLWVPVKGNVYYQLAHQYIAAELNELNGVTLPPTVKSAFDNATAWFGSTTPLTAAGLKGPMKQVVLNYASTLADFNEGKAGVPHCSD